MTQMLNRNKKGFTIIEVMIVLAIAGLIMVIVFLAIPQLQRNQRDNARQSVATRLSSELETYSSNNNGRYPFVGVGGGSAVCTTLAATGGCNDWYTRYITTPGVDHRDPSTGNNFVINLTTATTQPTWARGQAWISVGNSCNGEAFAAGSGGGANAKTYALMLALERNNTYYCVDNS